MRFWSRTSRGGRKGLHVNADTLTNCRVSAMTVGSLQYISVSANEAHLALWFTKEQLIDLRKTISKLID